MHNTRRVAVKYRNTARIILRECGNFRCFHNWHEYCLVIQVCIDLPTAAED